MIFPETPYSFLLRVQGLSSVSQGFSDLPKPPDLETLRHFWYWGFWGVWSVDSLNPKTTWFSRRPPSFFLLKLQGVPVSVSQGVSDKTFSRDILNPNPEDHLIIWDPPSRGAGIYPLIIKLAEHSGMKLTGSFGFSKRRGILTVLKLPLNLIGLSSRRQKSLLCRRCGVTWVTFFMSLHTAHGLSADLNQSKYLLHAVWFTAFVVSFAVRFCISM